MHDRQDSLHHPVLLLFKAWPASSGWFVVTRVHAPSDYTFLQLCRGHQSRQDSQSSQGRRCEVTFFTLLYFPLESRPQRKKSQHKIRLVRYGTLIHASLSPDQLRTRLHFTSEELDTLKGTNLHGATIDRRRVWEAERGRHVTWCVRNHRIRYIKKGTVTFAQERFFAVLTYLSTTCPRALPSTLPSLLPSLVQQPDSYLVVIQGVDAPMPSPFLGSSTASEHQLPPPPSYPAPIHRTGAYRP
jgi:hypothetical protein